MHAAAIAIAIAFLAASALGDVPEERQALVDLFESSGGPAWTSNTNWIGSGTVCAWQGVVCNADSSVVQLSLPRNALNGTIPASIAALSNLEVLVLSGNVLRGALPPAAFAAMPSLRNVDLSSNALTSTIPTTVTSCSSLM
jgi:Leucine-rich repeat (LRR) protein